MADNDDTEPEAEAQSFLDVLAEVQSGFFVENLSKEMAALNVAVRNQAKSGSLTVKLTVKPIPGNDELLQVLAEMKSALPRPTPAPSTFYVTRDGALSRDHPSQMTDPALNPSPAEPQETR